MNTSVLVVDDRPKTLAAHENVLSEIGVLVTFAKSPAEAISIMSNAPSFDAVIADLSFNEHEGEANVEGEEIGRWMQSTGYPGYSILCSARFGERDNEYQEALNYFNDSLSPNAKIEEYEELVNKAAKNRLNRLMSSQLLSTPEIALDRRESLLKIHTLTDLREGDSNADYFRQGYEIIVVQPFIEPFVVGSPFFVWRKHLAQGVFLEVYGQPTLIGFGTSFDESLSALNEVLVSTYIDTHDGRVMGPLEKVKNFLIAVYDEQVRASLANSRGDSSA